MSRLQAWVLIVIAAVAVGALVQMNRYEYFERNLGKAVYILRIDRLTGQQCVTFVPTMRFEPEDLLERVEIAAC